MVEIGVVRMQRLVTYHGASYKESSTRDEQQVQYDHP